MTDTPSSRQTGPAHSLRAGYDGEPYCSRCGTDRFTDECVDLAVPNPVTPPE